MNKESFPQSPDQQAELASQEAWTAQTGVDTDPAFAGMKAEAVDPYSPADDEATAASEAAWEKQSRPEAPMLPVGNIPGVLPEKVTINAPTAREIMVADSSKAASSVPVRIDEIVGKSDGTPATPANEGELPMPAGEEKTPELV